MAPMLAAPLLALGQDLYDRGGGVPRDRLAWAVAEADDFLAHAGPRTTLFFALAMLAVEWGPVLMSAGLGRMSRLTPERRRAYLERLDRSNLAILLALPKALLSLVYYEHPEALAETGYDGACLVPPARQGLTVLPARTDP